MLINALKGKKAPYIRENRILIIKPKYIMEHKTHYRKVFKSDHLGSADLEEFIEQGRPLIFTIKDVVQYLIDPKDKNTGISVAGRRISANIANFIEPIKPMVLNATNSSRVQKLAGGSPFVEDWKNITIEVYIDASVRMKGEVVGGVRIKEQAPQPFGEKEVNIVKGKITACVNLAELTNVYNSDIKIKTNAELIELFKQRKVEIMESE